MNRDQDDDLQALRRLLPELSERDFPASRQHQREEHLMTSWLTMSRRTDRHRSRGMRIALPAALAAATAGIALLALPAQTAAAYTLQTTADGTVKLAIINPSEKIDTASLQQDLDKLGVPSRVYIGDPDCPASESNPTTTPAESAAPTPGPGSADESWEMDNEDDKQVLYVDPGKISADEHLQIVFPLAKTDPAHASSVITAGLVSNPGPDCVPAPPADAVSVGD